MIGYVYPKVSDDMQFASAGTYNSRSSEQLIETRRNVYKSALIRRFDFTSSLQRMSVICKNQIDNKFKAFVKGSPEKISELCLPETLPNDF